MSVAVAIPVEEFRKARQNPCHHPWNLDKTLLRHIQTGRLGGHRFRLWANEVVLVPPRHGAQYRVQWNLDGLDSTKARHWHEKDISAKRPQSLGDGAGLKILIAFKMTKRQR